MEQKIITRKADVPEEKNQGKLWANETQKYDNWKMRMRTRLKRKNRLIKGKNTLSHMFPFNSF